MATEVNIFYMRAFAVGTAIGFIATHEQTATENFDDIIYDALSDTILMLFIVVPPGILV